MNRYSIQLLALHCFFCFSAWTAPRLKLQGSTTVNPVVSDAAELFRKKGWTVLVDTQGGSSGGISALAEGLVDLAMSSKPISDKDRAKYPKVKFVEHTIGFDGLALAVSKPVFDGGVKALTREQIQKIYESKIKNWKEVGGPDRPIVFFNKEPGRGSWEVFAHFLYGNADNAPSVSHPEVGANEEGRTKVASHGSAITQLSASWVWASEKISGLAIRLPGGKLAAPTLENIRTGFYPLRRSLFLVSNGALSGPAAEFVQYLLGEGQALLNKHGYLPLHSGGT